MAVWRLRFKRQRMKLSNKPPGVQWWQAASSLTPAAIRRAFKEERVGGVLYDALNAVRPTGEHLWNKKVLLIRLDVPEHPVDKWGVEFCLNEIGIELVKPVTVLEKR